MRQRLALHLTAAGLTAVILAPLAAPGYVLSYDMNFVPQQGMLWELVAPLDGAPRAVPIDALVSVINVVVPGWLLQRIALAAIIWANVVGAGRLVPTERTVIRIIAGVTYAWTPFLAERLLFGQWALLLAYAALPWLVIAARDFWQGSRSALPRLLLAAGVCSLTPTGGLIAMLVCAVFAAGLPWRRIASVGAGLLILNAPWILAGIVTSSDTRADPDGITAFAPRAENWAGPVWSLLGTGGIWNSETTPPSRASALVPLATVIIISAGLAGYRVFAARDPSAPRLVIASVAGLALAVLSTVPAGQFVLGWTIQHVPGSGIIRDSHKFVLPYALLLAVCAALGVERITQRLPREAGAVIAAAALIFPVATMPDLAFGAAGTLRPVSYPSAWDEAAQVMSAEPGPAVSLPMAEYRGYPWNDSRTVLDPAPRYFPVPVLIDDTVTVGRQVIAGESQRAADVRGLLDGGGSLTQTEFRWVLIQGSLSGVPVNALNGLDLVYSGQELALYRNPAPMATDRQIHRRIPIVLAILVAAFLYVWAARRFWRAR